MHVTDTQKKPPSESDIDITVENFEPTMSSRQVSHMSQHSGSYRPHLQMILQPVQEKISKKKFIEQKLMTQKGECAPPGTATKAKE